MISVDPVPEHANAEPHRRVMAAIKAASKAEIRAVLVAAGIITRGGVLAAHYRQPVAKKKARRRGASKTRTRRSNRR